MMAQLPLAPFLPPAAPPALVPECVFPDSEQPEKTIDKIGLSTFSWGRPLQKTTGIVPFHGTLGSLKEWQI